MHTARAPDNPERGSHRRPIILKLSAGELALRWQPIAECLPDFSRSSRHFEIRLVFVLARIFGRSASIITRCATTPADGRGCCGDSTTSQDLRDLAILSPDVLKLFVLGGSR